jgi:hypothetical protein
MMATTHALFHLYAGDDWNIPATLIDDDGVPYDLTSAEIQWTMVDAAGKSPIVVGDVTIVIIDALGGVCSIQVAASKTTAIAGGRYNDTLRITTGGITSTRNVGSVQVVADPWRVPQPVALRVVA